VAPCCFHWLSRAAPAAGQEKHVGDRNIFRDGRETALKLGGKMAMKKTTKGRMFYHVLSTKATIIQGSTQQTYYTIKIDK